MPAGREADSSMQCVCVGSEFWCTSLQSSMYFSSFSCGCECICTACADLQLVVLRSSSNRLQIEPARYFLLLPASYVGCYQLLLQVFLCGCHWSLGRAASLQKANARKVRLVRFVCGVSTHVARVCIRLVVLYKACLISILVSSSIRNSDLYFS
jgi:hypothetical protein